MASWWQQDLRRDWVTWSVGGCSRSVSLTCSTLPSLDAPGWESRCDLTRRSGSDPFVAGYAAPEQEQELNRRGQHQLQPRCWRGGYMSWSGSGNGIQRPGERHKGTCDPRQTTRTRSTSGFGSGSLPAAMLRCWRPCWDATTELTVA